MSIDRAKHAKELLDSLNNIIDNACACCLNSSLCYIEENHTKPRCSKFTYEQKVAIRTKAGKMVDLRG